MQITNPSVTALLFQTQQVGPQPHLTVSGNKPVFDPQQFLQNVMQNSTIGGSNPIISTTPATNSTTAVMDMTKIASQQFQLKNIPDDVLRGLIETIKRERKKSLSDKVDEKGNVIFYKIATKRYQEMIDGKFLDDEI